MAGLSLVRGVVGAGDEEAGFDTRSNCQAVLESWVVLLVVDTFQEVLEQVLLATHGEEADEIHTALAIPYTQEVHIPVVGSVVAYGREAFRLEAFRQLYAVCCLEEGQRP